MLGFIKSKLGKVFNYVTERVKKIFSSDKEAKEKVDEIFDLLLAADCSLDVAEYVKSELLALIESGNMDSDAMEQKLISVLTQILNDAGRANSTPEVLILVGVNGTGKTSAAAKLAARFKREGKNVVLAACDTFRAAAVEQLEILAERAGVRVIKGNPGQDPASVAFDAAREFAENGGKDAVLIVDTAGRMQTRKNLMKELEKIEKVVRKKVGEKKLEKWITIDAVLGQNSVEQAEVFSEFADLTGAILTKADGSGKGGTVFTIASKLKLPVVYISYGEALEDIAPFDPESFVNELIKGK